MKTMRNTLLKVSSVVALCILASSITAANYSAYAINGHGSHYGPEFGAGPYFTYNDALKINGSPFDISDYTTTIPTQKLYVNDQSDITLKIYHHANPQYIQHVVVYLNLQGQNPSISDSNLWLEYDKYDGLSIHDPQGIFKNVKAQVTTDNDFMYLTFKITPATTLNTTDMIITAWDDNLSTGQAVVLNAFKIGYIPEGFSR